MKQNTLDESRFQGRVMEAAATGERHRTPVMRNPESGFHESHTFWSSVAAGFVVCDGRKVTLPANLKGKAMPTTCPE